MKKSIFYILFFAVSQFIYAQSLGWLNYTCGNDIRTLTLDGDNVWVGSSLGLAKINKATEQITIFNKGNSSLPVNFIQAIAIDSSKNKWIGTTNGLVKFDDNNWSVYTTSNSGLPSNSIYAIEVDTSKNIWIGTAAGLVKYDGATWTVYNTSNSGLLSNYIRSISIDQKGVKWIGTSNGGVAKFDGANWKIYTIDNSMLPSNAVWTIYHDETGTAWIGTNGGLAEFDGTYWTVYDDSNSKMPANSVRTIAVDSLGFKWIGTLGGIAVFKGSNWRIYSTQGSPLPSDVITSIKIDELGDRWIGCAGGVIKFTRDVGLRINTSNSGLLDNTILALTIDKIGNAWFGNNNGLSLFDGTNWKNYTEQNSGLPNDYSHYPFNPVNAIAVDKDGRAWIGNSAGLSFLVSGPYWYRYHQGNSGLPSNTVQAITIDEKGDKWMGTPNGVAKLYNYPEWIVYNTSNSGLPNNFVTTITIDESGNKWFGTKEGIAKYNDTTWTAYTTSNSGLPNNLVQSIATDDSGNIWVGTPTGLAQFDGANWKIFTTTNSDLPNNNVYSIAVEGSKNKWIGTYGGGLAKYDGSSWTVFTMTNSGLFDNYISTVTINKSGNKWIGSIAGGLAIYKDIIPIELVSFIGSVVNSVVQLKWETTSETNNSGWYVQRKKALSKDPWKNVGFIQGKGTSQQTNNYFFEDKDLDTTHSYQYRLGQLDVDGSVRYSDTIAIHFTVPVEQGYFPLEIGNSWTYCSSQDTIYKRIYLIKDTINIEGKKCFLYGRDNDIVNDTLWKDTNGNVWKKNNDIFTLWFDFTKDSGAVYHYPGYLIDSFNVLVRKSLSIETYVEEFENCIQLQFDIPTFIDDEIWYTFAPEIGIIRKEGAWSNDILYSAIVNNIPVSIENDLRDVPTRFSLSQNFPNPFNPKTSIQYALPYESNVSITVYNTLGQIVKTFNEGAKASGSYSLNFNGEGLSSGIYLYSINAVSVDGKQNYRATKKMLLIK